jgi:hypothetical protein
LTNIIALLFSLELGFMPYNMWYQSGSQEREFITNSYYINLDVEAVIFDHVFIGGWIDTAMHKQPGGLLFDPLQQTYQFRAGLRWQNIELGYSHVCGPHPVMTYPQFGLNDNLAPFEGAVDKIYIKVSNH